MTVALLPLALIGFYLLLSPRLASALYRRLLFFPSALDDAASLSLATALGATPASVDFSADALHGWWFKHPESARRLTVLVSHGNSGSISGRGLLITFLYRLGLDVFIYDYSGFGRSKGVPSVSGVVSDGLAAYDYLVSENVSPGDIILYGESLGAAVSTAIAAQRQVGMLILQSGFASLRRIATDLYPVLGIYRQWLYPPPYLDSVGLLAKSHPPLLILHGDRDAVVPVSHARALYDAASGDRSLTVISGGAHSDLLLVAPELVARAIEDKITATYGLTISDLSGSADADHVSERDN